MCARIAFYHPSQEVQFLYHMFALVVVKMKRKKVFPYNEWYPKENLIGIVLELIEWKAIIKKNRRKISHPSRPRLVVVDASSTPKIYWISKFNILAEYTNTDTIVKNGKECARLLCTMWLLLCPWLSFVCSENDFREKPLALVQMKSFSSLCLSSLFIEVSSPHALTRERFSVNRKAFSPLPTPCNTVINPETLKSRLWKMCVSTARHQTYIIIRL